MTLRPVQTLATTRNIVGPNNVVQFQTHGELTIIEAILEKPTVTLRPVQTLATTRNIDGPNNVVSCCAVLADVCKRWQQVTTCWDFR